MSPTPGRAALATLAGVACLAVGPAAGHVARASAPDLGDPPPVAAGPAAEVASPAAGGVAAGRGPAPAAVAPGGPVGTPTSPSPGGTAPAGTQTPGTQTPGTPAPAPARPELPPVAVAFPAQGAGGPVVPVGVLPGGELALPDSPGTVGWWAGGAALGSPAGAVVLAGHVDSATDGVGVLATLTRLELGDEVALDDGTGGRQAYRVTARRSYPKADLPADAFAQDGPPRLVLITCGGAFDAGTGRYADNVVVTAEPA